MMMNVLMVTWDAGGNIPPLLGLGRELLRRGWRVRCLGPQGVRPAVERAGMKYLPLEHGATQDPLEPMSLEQSQQISGAVFFGGGYMTDLRAEVEQERPDVVVIDCFLVAAQAAAEAMGLPYVLLVHTLPGWLLPFWDQVLLPPTNGMRQGAGLAPVASTAQLWGRAALSLVVNTPLLDTPTVGESLLPGLLRYVGPIFEPENPEQLQAAMEVAAVALPEGKELPRVLVGTSTTFMDQERSLARVIEALGTLPVQALVTAGPAVDLDAASLPTATNVTVHRWLPHAAVLPRVSLAITHAGHSTVVKALSYGVPLLCLPLGRDQDFIAGRVQELGAGLSLSAEALPGELASAVMSLLQDHSYRDAAQQIADSIRAAGPGDGNAADEIEVIARPY